MKQKKTINWIKHICNSLLKCKNDEQAMQYKEEFNKLVANPKIKEKWYDILNLKVIDLYMNFKDNHFILSINNSISLNLLQTYYIPDILKGLKNEKE